MIKSKNLFASLKKPFITFLLSLVVFVLTLFLMTTITANAETLETTDIVETTATDVLETTSSEIDEGLLDGLLDINDTNGTLELVLLVTILSLAPSILIMMTSFVRIIIVFSMLRSAMGTQQSPPNQVLIGLALFLTMFIMAPTIDRINEEAYQPYANGEYTALEAASVATGPLKEFMLHNTSESSLDFFLALSDSELPAEETITDELGLEVVVPAYMLSEIKRAFTIGFLLFIPFLIIDIVVASVIMSMGMIMLPPATISLPFKILLFILVDGWQLLVGSLVTGFY